MQSVFWMIHLYFLIKNNQFDLGGLEVIWIEEEKGAGWDDFENNQNRQMKPLKVKLGGGSILTRISAHSRH